LQLAPAARRGGWLAAALLGALGLIGGLAWRPRRAG
jgi:hypothetical protein